MHLEDKSRTLVIPLLCETHLILKVIKERTNDALEISCLQYPNTKFVPKTWRDLNAKSMFLSYEGNSCTLLKCN